MNLQSYKIILIIFNNIINYITYNSKCKTSAVIAGDAEPPLWKTVVYCCCT